MYLAWKGRFNCWTMHFFLQFKSLTLPSRQTQSFFLIGHIELIPDSDCSCRDRDRFIRSDKTSQVGNLTPDISLFSFCMNKTSWLDEDNSKKSMNRLELLQYLHKTSTCEPQAKVTICSNLNKKDNCDWLTSGSTNKWPERRTDKRTVQKSSRAP